MIKLKVLQRSLSEAESNAKKRDIEVENEKYVDIEVVNEMEERANKLGYGLYKIHNKNQAGFIQTIYENWDIVIRNQYLTNAELAFLISIQPLIEYQVNAIINKETGQFMTVSEIAKYMNKDRTGVSRIIQSLIRKGILFEFVNVEELREFNRNVTSRTLFVNPELFYAGDRNKIDGTLAMLVSQYDKLEKDGLLLSWKVWKKQGHTFGKLYRRKTYLEIKKKSKR